MRATCAPTAACAGSKFIANASCCAVPSRACGWPSMFASATFSALALRGLDGDAQVLVLAHRDPSLTIPLAVSADRAELEAASAMWSEIFALPQLPEEKRSRAGPAPPPPQRHQPAPSEIPGAPPRRRYLPRTLHASRRARDHRAELDRDSLVGWVERSETHRLSITLLDDGFRFALPILRRSRMSPAAPHRSRGLRTRAAPPRGSTRTISGIARDR